MTDIEQTYQKVFHHYSKLDGGLAVACMELAKLKVEIPRLQNTICQLRQLLKIDEAGNPITPIYRPKSGAAKSYSRLFPNPVITVES